MRKLKVLDFEDRSYYSELVRIGLPVMIQNVIFNGLTMIDNVMIGGLGDTAISAVGIANKLSFVFILFLFGVNSGSSVFGAQFWGKGDLAAIRKVLGISLRICLVASIPFFLVSQLLPRQVMTFFIRDAQVIEQGVSFLRIIGWSYVIQAITAAYAIQSRGVGRTRPPLYASAVALGINTFLNYSLIYGRFGLPAMGVRGSATATLIARILEAGILLAIIYGRKYELAATISEMSGYSRDFIRRFVRPVLPVIANEILWAIGVSMYTFFYGMQGVKSTTTAQIMEVMNGLFFSLFFGLGSACGVMIGNRIGAREDDIARVYAKRSIVLGSGLGLCMGCALAVAAPFFLSFFNVGPEILSDCRIAAYVFASTMSLRVINLIMVVGVCRNGGDTVFAALIDVLSPWCVGIPMAALGVLVLKWPIYLVMALVSLEEVVKAVFGIWRLFSGKWLNNLVHDLHGGEVVQAGAGAVSSEV
jgi:putative MATE family efflux protein